MTRTDIADYLGLTIETVSRTFTKLRKSGVIEVPDAHTVTLTDLAGLAGADRRRIGRAQSSSS